MPAVEMKKDLPELQDEVTVVGFPVGGDNTCVTVGVVSRIDMQTYGSRGCKDLLAIQIDAAINPGNSGGPCWRAIEGGREVLCIGVAFQTLAREDIQNIGYIIPAEVVEHFMEDYRRNGRYTGFGSCGFLTQPLENEHMRAALGMRKNQSGALVRKIDPSTPASRVFKKGDIVLNVEGQDVGNDAKIPFRGEQNERIDLSYLVSKKFVDQDCRFTILRDKREHDCVMNLSLLQPLVPRLPEVPPKYFIVGGLVFVPLSEPFLLHEYGEKFEQIAPIRLMWYWTEGLRKFLGHEVVVLSQVLASPLTVGFTEYFNVVLKRFNGKEPKSLQNLVEMVDACKDENLIFELEHEKTILLPREKAAKEQPKILEDNMVPHDRSKQYRSSENSTAMP
eukprot:gnl/TRDRNA2_/TRDRNA2_104083_c0_seq1.p1 gnl/TRDRNA2_/TRDRNA2_104083_c0~~gnl/TRDRNA2_/TRDRNA2_104083_c0_seq1.p1  ORF type:complete len:400 (-),score=63.88 gnl/TRDRNA2_/TRDRNA2_104083_c0_seq1:94-1266(-)